MYLILQQGMMKWTNLNNLTNNKNSKVNEDAKQKVLKKINQQKEMEKEKGLKNIV